MNPTEYPAVNQAVTDLIFHESESPRQIDINYKALEVSSINLISKLENLLAKAREMPRDDFVDEAAGIARKMLFNLTEFSDEYFQGGVADQSTEEIVNSLACVDAYEKVLKTRPLTNAIIRTFWQINELEAIKTAHERLGESLVRACAATFYPMVIMIGLDNPFGQQIDQSTVVFINELKQTWNESNA